MTSSEAPVIPDVEPSEDCPMTQWEDWSPCEGICQNGVLKGYMWRERYHLVNGVPVEMYDPDVRPISTNKYLTFFMLH